MQREVAERCSRLQVVARKLPVMNKFLIEEKSCSSSSSDVELLMVSFLGGEKLDSERGRKDFRESTGAGDCSNMKMGGRNVDVEQQRMPSVVDLEQNSEDVHTTTRVANSDLGQWANVEDEDER
ncbi:hypothetical protein NE237_002868 [Protea cynaroides]|uniref:Uncharacterized protein n=1 Tax=Protea cynaroides TaxID=273540 RepID=A0A9Q0KFZ9_9MAGN|nr:hypothetical protein NE237_002868 [Protea cynaroides]